MSSDTKKQIRVTEEQRALLHRLKDPGESYSDVLGELIEKAGIEEPPEA